jgi:[protein-PII] uridylyltransferase
MSTAAMLRTELRDLYLAETTRIQQDFANTGDGSAAIAARTALVEQVLLRLWGEVICPGGSDPKNFVLVALGGFGRRALFPHSDVDILFLHADRSTEYALRDPIRNFSQELWDLRMKLGPTTRTLAECDNFDPQNVEFTISLLDCRYLVGDRDLFERLREKILPKFFVREGNYIIQQLAEVTRSRHAKYGNTVFHLEPNIKEAPGGLRDYNVAGWMALLSALDQQRRWPDPASLLPDSTRQLQPALEFLTSVRTFLHYRQGRDDNMLTWESQDEAATRHIGMNGPAPLDAAVWMRSYFRHARALHHECLRLLESVPAARSSLYRSYQNWRSRLSNADFSVVDGLIYLHQASSVRDPELLFRIFSFSAHHGLKPALSTETRIQQVLPALTENSPSGPDSWRYLQSVLVEPYAADALRTMHSLGLLTILLPELKLIDCLVVRDFYHRFTVDEHSFLAIECLHRANHASSEWDQRYGHLLEELERPELLYLALLLHDVGKGVPGASHLITGLEIAHKCMDRLALDQSARETISFLIASHLEISATLRRDIYDPGTVQAFCDKVGTPERLKLLALLTYADIKAVNPDALTPWKAENVWQLYIAASNCLSRTADQRVHADQEHDASIAALNALVPHSANKLRPFLEGLPKRYLRTFGAKEILQHLELSEHLAADPVQLHLARGRHWYELSVVTNDRPFLFANIAGTLAAWGMNIVKADAFSNAAGVVVDTFYFTDRFRTLELNIPEWDRFKRSVADVLNGDVDLDRMLRDRVRSEQRNIAKVKIQNRVEFDDEASASSTLVQVIAQDQLGLLHRICSRFSQHGCNIEIALIDTEGQMAIDVFYLTSNGKKIPPGLHTELRADLLEELCVLPR